jgi:hypothetical protein
MNKVHPCEGDSCQEQKDMPWWWMVLIWIVITFAIIGVAHTFDVVRSKLDCYATCGSD